MANTWIILGGTSTMARHFARQAADRGEGVILCGRDTTDMEATASDCMAHGAPLAEVMAFDARKPDTFAPILKRASDIDGTISAAVFVGSMPAQDRIDDDPSLVDGTVHDSFTGPARFLTALAPLLESRGTGTIVGVGSVAGDRGRIGNYVYGAAKSGFHAYLSGLRNRLGRAGVHVMTVKPGPVDTAMTQGLGDQPFMAQPEDVVRSIFKAADKKRNVLYTPIIWWPIMTIIKLIPESIFKKMSI